MASFSLWIEVWCWFSREYEILSIIPFLNLFSPESAFIGGFVHSEGIEVLAEVKNFSISFCSEEILELIMVPVPEISTSCCWLLTSAEEEIELLGRMANGVG